MVLVTVNGVEVDFPYNPYPEQLRYMSAVVEALRAGSNALLESPTGTGKTLCLLCAALAWRSLYHAALQANAHANTALPSSTPATNLLAKAGLRPPTGAASALSALSGAPSAAYLKAPRIVFSSRTHSQLSQAVAELKKTSYKPAMTMLASRDQLCVHETASNLSGSRLSAMCRKLTAPSRRACRFHLPVASPRAHENRSAELIEKLQAQPPLDIEDLRTFAMAESACPFFLSRATARSEACDILFLPYNYLLDKAARASLDIDWSNDILIVDEAHNLESICSDAMSFDLTKSVRHTAGEDLFKLIETGLRPGGISIPALEKKAMSEAGIESVIGSENDALRQIRNLRSLLTELEKFVDGISFDRGQSTDVSFRVLPATELRSILQSAGGPTVDDYETFLEVLDTAMELQAEATKLTTGTVASEDGSSTQTSSAIRVVQAAIRVLYESAGRGEEEAFRVVVHDAQNKPNAGRTLSYWCFKPALAMRELARLNLRSLLLTSGTLAPLDAFGAELGLPFPVRLENPHVVTAAQVWAGVVRTGPDGLGVRSGRLSSAYAMRGDESYFQLGRTLIRIASLVPDGLLVFFPSYSTLYSTIEAWRRLGPEENRAKPSIWEHLLKMKDIIVEEREASKTSAAILAHRANVDAGKGSILFAVCRGKIAEGIDFSDEYGRAVVITGLPYPSATDPRVILKREHADEMLRKSGQPTGAPRALSGAQWYTTQALRAVNQAVGRAIRHRLDYGAIILCDERFQSGHLQGLISKWIRPRLATHATFNEAELSLDRFYAAAKMSGFAKEAAIRRVNVKRTEEAQRPVSQEDSTAAVQIAQHALSRMMPAAPAMDKSFVDRMVSMSDALGEIDQTELIASKTKVDERGEAFSAFNFDSKREQGALTRVRHTGSSSHFSPPPLVATQSTRFLSQRNAEGNGIGLGPVAKKQRTDSGTVRTGKLSTQVKEKFGTRDEQRAFLKMFREMLGADAVLQNGDPSKAAGAQARAKEVVTGMVRYVRDRGSGVEGFLDELRERIPVALQEEYDAARVQQ